MRTPVLLLTHRIPFPPNKGDKIRSYHLLLELNKHYDVHLGCFIDDAADWQYLQSLRPHCASVHAVPLPRYTRYLKALLALLQGKAITLPLYHSAKLQQWVRQTMSHHAIKRVVLFSGAMAQYVESSRFDSVARVIDFVDVDSDKWAQYAQQKSGLSRWIYQREHRLLQCYEQRIAQQFDTSLFVSEQEAALFKAMLPADISSKIDYLNNGVDHHYFNPEQICNHAPVHPARFIVFTGAMDYWANADAVNWFCTAIWPRLRHYDPDLAFYIVGSKPSSKVLQLNKLDGVYVTGSVVDIRPYLHQSTLVVAPMRIARGIQNKVLEAMSMAKSIVTTSMALEGIPYNGSPSIKIADSVENFGAACIELLSTTDQRASQSNRRWVIDQFSWSETLSKLQHHIETSTK